MLKNKGKKKPSVLSNGNRICIKEIKYAHKRYILTHKYTLIWGRVSKTCLYK